MKNHLKLPRQLLLEHVGSIDQIASMRRFQLLEGKAKGVEAIDVRTGSGFNFTVLVDRALDLADASYGGQSLSWRSSAGIVAPSYYERKGAGWLRGFGGGMMVTCGLRNVGPGSEEQWETYGLHGELSYRPATELNVKSGWIESGYQMEISGVMREAYPFGPNLSVRRTWKTQLGAEWVELEDVVTNEGFRPEIHMQLYHWNFGFPLLNRHSQLHVTPDVVAPRDEAAAKGLPNCFAFEPPTQDFAEQVFFHSYRGHPPATSSALLISDGQKRDFAAHLSYETSQLPYLVQWKSCAKGEYVLGIEPGNCLVEGREWHRKQQRAELMPGESKTFRLRLSVVTNAAAVAEALRSYPERKGPPRP